MPDKYDTVIIGAGPAGLAAAEELGRHSKKVLLVEKNSRIGPKICAGGISPGITKHGFSLDFPHRAISAIKINTPGKIHHISLPEPFIIIANREIFGQYQLKRVLRYDVDIITGAFVKKISSNHIALNDRSIEFKHLIGADGSVSVVRKHLGLKTHKYGLTYQYRLPVTSEFFQLFFDHRFFGTGYGWSVPHNNHTFIGTGEARGEYSKLNIKQRCRDWCNQQGYDLTGATAEAWPINYDYRGWQFDNIFLAGDAAGLASGLTGIGIYNALVSGLEAARKIINPDYACPEIKKILRQKKYHDRLLGLLQSHRGMINIYHRVLLSMTGTNYLKKKLMDFLF